MGIGNLYIVGTPIGNLKDITYRAIEILNNVDFIAAEDTRTTIKLLNYYNIQNNLISYHEHSSFDKINQIIDEILFGKNCALVSDAGMPCISDPGERLVKLAYENNIKVFAVPGPCAAISGLAISGLSTSRFVFEGFLSTNKKNRLDVLESLVSEKRTIIFYEAPHKLKRTINDLYDIFGDRRISVIKEITKIYESVMITTLKKAKDYFESIEKIKGEYVLILEGSKNSIEVFTIEEAVRMIKEIHNNGIKYSEAIKSISEKTGYKKNVLYKLVLENKYKE